MTDLKRTAHQNLNIPLDNKIILSIDGGGMRGILTIQLLKKMENLAGSPCYEWCDMVAGTSTGAIIASLILSKKNAIEIEELYKKLVTRVFTKRNFFSNRYVNPPAFDKKNYRELLKSLIGNVTIEKACLNSNLDCLLTSKDMSAGEETFFTCIVAENRDTIGTYKSVLLRAVMEATMSAPTYFLPMERFIDGGTTTYNNPTMAAILEALEYTGTNKYEKEKITVFSLGTGTTLRFIDPNETANPNGPDIKFWLNYVMAETSKDASEMQIDFLRSGILRNLDLRRYQISFDEKSMKKLDNKSIAHIYKLKADFLYDLKNSELGDIDMADVTLFPLMETIGQAMVEFICPPKEARLAINNRKGNWFRHDFINDKKRGLLMTVNGQPPIIASNLSNAKWVDSQRTA